MFTRVTQCTRDVLDPSVSTFSFSLYRHPFIYTLFTSRFTLLDLLIVHDRFGSSSDPSLNGHLHHLNDNKSLNETTTDKIRKYHTDYNNPPTSVSFMPDVVSTSGRLPIPSKSHTHPSHLHGTPITSRTHTHPSHSQTSRLLTSS